MVMQPVKADQALQVKKVVESDRDCMMAGCKGKRDGKACNNNHAGSAAT